MVPRGPSAGIPAVPALLLLMLPLLFDLFVLVMVKAAVKLFWRLPGREHFRVTGSRMVRPLHQKKFTHQLSSLDKVTSPAFNVCFDYFYEQDLDVDLLCTALSHIITDLPVLCGKVKGLMPWARVECDGDGGVEVVTAETNYTLRDVHLHGDSPAMTRISCLHATGFGAGDPFDNLMPVNCWWSGGAPVMRVRITKLAGGGTALGVSASHTAMDGESLKKVVELWAKETRRLMSMPEETGDCKGQEEEEAQGGGHIGGCEEGREGGGRTGDVEAETEAQGGGPIGGCEGEEEGGAQIGDLEQGALGAGQSPADGCEEDEDSGVLSYTPKDMGLLDTTVMNDFVAEAAQAQKDPGMTLWRFLYMYLHFNKQCFWAFPWAFCVGGMGSKTFFFADDFMATTKAQVMKELAASPDPDKPSFVSTNDIVCAMVWQAMRRASSWFPGRSTCVSVVSVRERLVREKFKNTKNADRFLFGNACLQARAGHADTAGASALELAVSIRESLQALTPAKLHEQLGRYQARDQLLGLWTGPDFQDLNITKDFLFTAFSPLEGDTDFGHGSAYFYHLDTTPTGFLVHPNRGYDHNDGNRKGTYVTVLAPKSTLGGLAKHLGGFLPAAPVASDSTLAAKCGV